MEQLAQDFRYACGANSMGRILWGLPVTCIESANGDANGSRRTHGKRLGNPTIGRPALLAQHRGDFHLPSGILWIADGGTDILSAPLHFGFEHRGPTLLLERARLGPW